MLIENEAAISANVAKHSATNQLNSYRTIEENRFLYVIRNRTLVVTKHIAFGLSIWIFI